MDISYLGHSCFKLRGKTGTVVTDPFDPKIGLAPIKTSADVVTVSHHHFDHDFISAVSGTARKEKPFIIDLPGEYELMEISVFAFSTFHDDQQGKLRGVNNIMAIHLDGINVVHLGDLGHTLSDKLIDDLGKIDVLIVPVGGVYTIGPKQASQIVEAVEPSIVIPMHYQLPSLDEQFKELSSVEVFLKEMGKEGIEPKDKLTVSPGSLPEEMEIVVLKAN